MRYTYTFHLSNGDSIGYESDLDAHDLDNEILKSGLIVIPSEKSTYYIKPEHLVYTQVTEN